MGRIIAGRAKGARFAAPRGDATRPTSDRVREALFSSLATWFGVADEAPGAQLAGVSVLDLFAGSGALGLEAASRGAARVVGVDQRTAALIRDNARRLRLAVEARPGRVERVLDEVDGAFDLVLLDPPYDLPAAHLDALLARLAGAGRLSDDALVVVERSRRTPSPTWPAGFARTWSRDYGETTLHFGAYETKEPA